MCTGEVASAVALHACKPPQDVSACLNASHAAAGLYSLSLTLRLAHLCDTVVGLEAVRDDSDIVRLIPEPARCRLLLHPPEHKLKTIRVLTSCILCRLNYKNRQVCCHIFAAL